ncbi:TIM barrel protein [Rhabdobacter roseus]|uniref:Sugar phosphate isomerase/epimerase n=1 Tax=Rhabdobacter roseus TaxID=1655419 RepID=A0A840TTE4_9BACT|nr:TIM barrel protein [Rhabdobacter roseus]MBB5286554.1 sugar phosphate isomerase/epimerase [Rhabdobacter roseus]
MDLGISTYTYPWAVGVPGYGPAQPLALPELLEIGHRLAVKRLQIGDNLPVHTLPSTSWCEAIRRAGQLGVQLELGTRRLEREHIGRYLELAAQAGSPFLRVVVDDQGYAPSRAEVVAEVRALLPQLREQKIRLGIENHDRFSAKSLQIIVESTDPDWVGICLDTSNSLGAGEGVAYLVEILAPYVINLHYKDIAIRRVAHKMGFEVAGCAPGQGLIDPRYLLSTLSKYLRCESVTLEQWPPYLGTLEATIRQEAAWAEEGIDLLKNTLKNYTQ